MSLEINKDYKKKWLITGVAGFIGSNLLEELLLRDQTVFGIDNFSTGSQDNLDFVKNAVGKNDIQISHLFKEIFVIMIFVLI